MSTTLRTTSTHPHFLQLVKSLDVYLAEMDGEEHAFYDQYNKPDNIKHVLLAYENEIPIGCGAMKENAPGVMEIKRMFTLPESRGKGVATKILKELELWAEQLGYKKCILETGKRQMEAVAFYQKNSYKPIPNYGQYKGMENSLCFEKDLK